MCIFSCNLITSLCIHEPGNSTITFLQNLERYWHSLLPINQTVHTYDTILNLHNTSYNYCVVCHWIGNLYTRLFKQVLALHGPISSVIQK